MIRLIFLLHRYLGIAVGALMVMWCLSGVVMMYVGYPVLEQQRRLDALTPIDWNGCCRSASSRAIFSGAENVFKCGTSDWSPSNATLPDGLSLQSRFFKSL